MDSGEIDLVRRKSKESNPDHNLNCLVYMHWSWGQQRQTVGFAETSSPPSMCLEGSSQHYITEAPLSAPHLRIHAMALQNVMADALPNLIEGQAISIPRPVT